jgi:hypothetical protein
VKTGATYSFLICISITWSCVDPIRLKTKDGDGTLVVDGLITDEAGPYSVKLSRTITFDNSRPLKVYTVPERDATVVIYDDAGISETLSESEPGVYKTASIAGTVGKTYSITIKTSDGDSFYSESETMPVVAKVDSIKHEFVIYDRFFINANNQPQTKKAEGFEISAVTTDPAGYGNFYRWQANGIFEFFSLVENPDVHTCWVSLSRLEGHLEIADDLLNDGQSFSHRVCVVQYDRPTRYMVKMKQASLTERAYRYWRDSEKQQTSTGSIFDPPPTALIGNIKSDDDVPALGFFGASSVAACNVLFDRYRASGFVLPDPNPPLQAGDCRLQWPGATNVRPEGF